MCQADNTASMKDLKAKLLRRYKARDLRPISFYLGIRMCCTTVPNDPPRSYLGPISLLLTRTSLYIHSIYLHSNTLLANPFQVLVACPRESYMIVLTAPSL